MQNKTGENIETLFNSVEDHIVSKDMEKAKESLRYFLIEKTGIHEDGFSIGDILKKYRTKPNTDRVIPIVLIRTIAVDGVLPPSSEINQLERSIVEICEKEAPELCEFFKIERNGKQNFQKFEALLSGHSKICNLLDPMTNVYGDIDSLYNSKKSVLAPLNHKILSSYCRLFGLQEAKATIEAIYGAIGRLQKLDSSFLQSYQEFKQVMLEANTMLSAKKSFFSETYIRVFLKSTEALVDKFIASVREEYHSKIIRGGLDPKYLQKRYPMHMRGRRFSLSVPMRNEGNGLAVNLAVLAITSEANVEFVNHTISLGDIRPGEFSIVLDTIVHEPVDEINGYLEFSWGEIGNPQRLSSEIEFGVRAQSKEVDWEKLELEAPYSTSVAEGENFIGRRDLIKDLSSRLIRTPMEPFYITGQKRVGKTSLVLATMEYASNTAHNGSLKYNYILWGDVSNVDPLKSLSVLGEKIEQFILKELPGSNQIEGKSYDGSLSPLIEIAEIALEIQPEKKFVIVLDEFDEIPKELFKSGDLAFTFFGNLRSISRMRNICLVLVGGENMPFIMERQGEYLNNFSRLNLSYFSRESEWQDFQEMVRKPVENHLIWHDDAVNEVFGLSNGNPFFAKLVCASVYQQAISEKDTDITNREVKTAVERTIAQLGSNSFTHLWRDGIPKPREEREPDVLRRSRVLVAIARCKRHGDIQNIENIVEHRASHSLSQSEVPSVLNDFVLRNVLTEMHGIFSYVLPIFDKWLVDVGAQQLISDSLSEELANTVVLEENAATIKSEEVLQLSKSWPTYRGQEITTDQIRAWLQQVRNPKDQRLLFQLLQRTKFFGEAYLRERLQGAFSVVRPDLPEFIQKIRNERRNDVILTYIDGEGKSGQTYASMFADANKIPVDAISQPSELREKISERTAKFGQQAAILIIDDVAATGRGLSENITIFLAEHADLLQNIKLRILTIVSTKSAAEYILKKMEIVKDVDIDFLTCETLDNKHYAFAEDKCGFNSIAEWESAKALCRDLGVKIDKKNPFGFGELGLLLVFPNNTPNNTLPILRTRSKSVDGQQWEPLFERIVH